MSLNAALSLASWGASEVTLEVSPRGAGTKLGKPSHWAPPATGGPERGGDDPHHPAIAQGTAAFPAAAPQEGGGGAAAREGEAALAWEGPALSCPAPAPSPPPVHTPA